MTAKDQMPEGVVADSARNWVDHWAPRITRPYLRLSRADRPIGTWLLFLPCMWGLTLAMLADNQASAFDIWIIAGSAIGAFLMRGAGCTWNDITDPSGQVTVRGALAWMLVQTLVSLLILLTFPTIAILLGFVAVIPVLIYPFAKRFTWWPQVFLGVAFNWGALLIWAAHSGSMGWTPVVIYGAGILWTLFYDTIYAYQDAEDDALIGVKSTARLFGDNAAIWLRAFLAGAVLFLGLAVVLACRDRSILSLVVALIGPWALGWHLSWQLIRFDPQDNLGLLRLFRSNRDAGLLPLPFFAVAMLV